MGKSSGIREQRQRREISRRRLRLYRPLLRYSNSRDAWVLIGIGGRHGPVYKVAVAAVPVEPGVSQDPPAT